MKLTIALAGLFLAAPVLFAETPAVVSLALEDQFERRQDLKNYRGEVVVLLYGDRKSTETNRVLGERLHVEFHPTAKGLAPADARKAPAAAVAGLPAGKKAPNVQIVPVACTGKVPGVITALVRREIKKASPDVPVWLDGDDRMKDAFGQHEGEPNLVVIDAAGRLRFRALGEMDAKTYGRLVEVIDYLRKEAVGVK